MSSSPINYSNQNKRAFGNKVKKNSTTQAENCDDENEGGVTVKSLERIPTTMSGVGHVGRQQNKTKLAIASAETMSPSLKNYADAPNNLIQ